jgi:hypothetical protein
MQRELDHLELPVWQRQPHRRKPHGGRLPVRDHRSHGQVIADQAEEVEQDLRQRIQNKPPHINPKLVFKLQLNQKGNLENADLTRLGLHLLSRNIVDPGNWTRKEPEIR